MLIQKKLIKSIVAINSDYKENRRVTKLTSLLFSAAVIITASQTVNAEINQCTTQKTLSIGPVAGWDFNAGDLPSTENGIVSWIGDHGGIKPVGKTGLQGIEFTFKGKELDQDSSSEWRYKLTSPITNTWEYLKIYQPENFYHRSGIKVTSPSDIDMDLWRAGDIVVTSTGIRATVSKVEGKILYVTAYDEMFSLNWGKGKEIVNLNSNASFISEGYRYLGNNNKFSTQWHGRYSNAGMTMETESYPPARGYENGVSYCRPTVNSSESHRGRGTEKNDLGDYAECFHPQDNGTTVEFVIERIRSTSLTAEDGSYRIWKKTESTDWVMIYEKINLTAFQPDNYFTDGYVFGWSNSGYSEDTSFYLLGWELWSEKPDFVF